MTEAYAPTETPAEPIETPEQSAAIVDANLARMGLSLGGVSVDDPKSDTELSFFELVGVVSAAHVAQDLPYFTGIYQNHPGTGYVVIHFATAEDAAAWRKFFHVRGHRSEPSWWVWGWFGWTVELAVAPVRA